jgi:hypothetical protein
VDGSVPAIVYDDGRMTEAARVWFILQYFGATALILNGGWPAIQNREGLRGFVSEAACDPDAATIVTRMCGDASQRWLRSRIYARD